MSQVRPRRPDEPVVRFETPPGKQAQVDFGRFRLPWGLRSCLLVVLGYSRVLWLTFYRRKDLRTLFMGLESAFQFFGGTAEELLFDQMRTVITRDDRLRGGDLVTNAEFRRFAAHWGFTPRACRPHRAQTKGKVQRPIRYVRGNFFYGGREFLNDADLNQQALVWLDRVANVRVHATLQERPYERFLRDEQAALRPLASRPYASVLVQPQLEFELAAPPRPAPRLVVERRPLATYQGLLEQRS